MVSQGPDLDEVGNVTLRLLPRRCVRAAFETSGSHARLRRTQEPEERAIATQPACLGRQASLFLALSTLPSARLDGVTSREAQVIDSSPLPSEA